MPKLGVPGIRLNPEMPPTVNLESPKSIEVSKSGQNAKDSAKLDAQKTQPTKCTSADGATVLAATANPAYREVTARHQESSTSLLGNEPSYTFASIDGNTNTLDESTEQSTPKKTRGLQDPTSETREYPVTLSLAASSIKKNKETDDDEGEDECSAAGCSERDGESLTKKETDKLVDPGFTVNSAISSQDGTGSNALLHKTDYEQSELPHKPQKKESQANELGEQQSSLEPEIEPPVSLVRSAVVRETGGTAGPMRSILCNGGRLALRTTQSEVSEEWPQMSNSRAKSSPSVHFAHDLGTIRFFRRHDRPVNVSLCGWRAVDAPVIPSDIPNSITTVIAAKLIPPFSQNNTEQYQAEYPSLSAPTSAPELEDKVDSTARLTTEQEKKEEGQEVNAESCATRVAPVQSGGNEIIKLCPGVCKAEWHNEHFGGCVRVKLYVENRTFEKYVNVRCTLDGWMSHTDNAARYTSSPTPQTDEFEAWVRVPAPSPGAQIELELAVQVTYRGHGGQHEVWLNNDGKNYHIIVSHVHVCVQDQSQQQQQQQQQLDQQQERRQSLLNMPQYPHTYFEPRVPRSA